jgi:hypothetical protein
MTTRAERCGCGRVPGFRSRHSAPAHVETWVQCAGCGRTGESVIDAARDEAGAAGLWNDGKRREW